MADIRVVVVGSSGALTDSTDFPAEETVLGRKEQDPGSRIPSDLVQQLLVQRSRQHRGGAVETDTDEHMRELDRLPADPSGDYTVQSGGRHRFTAPSSRGLGTASTAARSREESGCK